MNKHKGKVLQGKIVAKPTEKTVIVSVENVTRHPLYKKEIRRTRKFAADTGSLDLSVSDHVMIKETRPISKTKHFIVIEKI